MIIILETKLNQLKYKLRISTDNNMITKKQHTLWKAFLMILSVLGFCTESISQTFPLEISNNIVSSGFHNYCYEAQESITLNPTPVGNDGTYLPGFFAVVYDNSTNIPLPSSALNYQKETAVFVSGIQTDAAVQALTVGQCLRTITYEDDLGRSVQSINQQYSPAQKDLVRYAEFDINGLTTKSYLSYVSPNADGLYRPLAKSEQAAFFQAANDKIANTNYPYSERTYEASPMNLVSEESMPGDSWNILPAQTGNTKKSSFRNNNSNEVLLWTLDNTTGNASAQVSGTPVYYNANTLFVQEVKDRNGVQTIIYKDREDKIIYTKKLNGVSGYLETYNVYDDLNRLRFIVTPEAMSNGIMQLYYSNATTDKWIFAFLYDAKGRMIERKKPGGVTFKVLYDKLDRPVLKQSNIQAATGQWSFAKYDRFGRIIQTGIYTDARAQSVIQQEINADATVLYESKIAASTMMGYSNNAYPKTITNADLLVVNYYDTYDFDENGTADYFYVNAGLGTSEPIPFGRMRGKRTGVKSRILTTNNWLISAGFYDNRGRPIQTLKNNQLYLSSNVGSTNLPDMNTFVYDFSGKMLKNKQLHVPGGALASVTSLYRYTYDHIGRSIKDYLTINAQTEVLLCMKEYNELGQLVDKKLHSENDGASFLQSIDYRYNTPGWLTSINNSSRSIDGVTNDETNDLFGMDLFYDKDAGLDTYANVPSFIGNITALKWSTSNTLTNTNQRAYTYTYDPSGKLLGSQYLEKSPTWLSNTNNFEGNITYSSNGNILSLKRNSGTGSTWDNLTYTYDGNKLTHVTEAADLAGGFASTAAAQQAGTIQYTYDANGNMTSDANKGITLITYNHLNLPTKVTLASGINIQYVYDASGSLLGKSTYNGTTLITNNQYVGSFLYTGGALQYMTTPYGKTEFTTGAVFGFVYYLKDHLGNNRISFDKDPITGLARIVQENHYYPFGLRFGNGPSYSFGSDDKFLFSDKEWQAEIGLYDFGSRQYDPVLGRWTTPDPADQDFSSYLYCGNDPINRIDPTGNSWFKDEMYQFGDWVNDNKKTIETVVVIAVTVVIAIVTDGIGEVFMEGILDDVLAEDAADMGAEAISDGFSGAMASGTGGGLQAVVDDQSFNLKDIHDGITEGTLAGFFGGAAEEGFGNLKFMEGVEEVSPKWVTTGMKGMVGGAASGFVQGFSESVLKGGDGAGWGRDWKVGLTEGSYGMGIGAFVGIVGGAEEGFRGKNYEKTTDDITKSFEEYKEKYHKGFNEYRISRKGMYTNFRMVDAIYFQGSGVGEVINQFTEGMSDTFLKSPKEWINKLYWGGDPMPEEEGGEEEE